MTPEKIKQLFPRASKATIDLNADGLPSGAEPQSVVHDGADGSAEGKAKNSTRYAVRITSYRVRLLDRDNLIGKYFVDSLRYSGAISGDREEDIAYSICQKKVEKKSQEKTLIEVEAI